jgi:hypothetical protein
MPAPTTLPTRESTAAATHERLVAFAVKLGLPGTVSSDWLSAS